MTDSDLPDRGLRARARAALKKLTTPVVDRLVNRTADAVRSDLQADRGRSNDENASLAATVDQLKAEVELLWAELESRRGYTEE